MDTVTKERRSWIMSRIRSKNTKPEERMKDLLREVGTGFQHDDWTLPGRPDFTIADRRLAVFVDGCFFHGCPAHYKLPKSNRAFWHNKITNNMRRDKRVDGQLRRKGWSVMRVWEHSTRPGSAEKLLERLGKRIATRRVSQAAELAVPDRMEA